jgi:proteasome lid subunit RPN8/RPN11
VADRVRLPAEMRRAMLAHAIDGLPLEACGVVVGRGDRPLRFVATANAAASPTRYEIAPRDLLRITLEVEAAGEAIWGIFHSHPASAAYPSATDIRLAFYPESIYLIASLIDRERPELRGFHIVDGQVAEVVLEDEAAPGAP